MGRKDKRIRELEAEVEALRAELERMREAELARLRSQMAEIRAKIAVDAVRRVRFDTCKAGVVPFVVVDNLQDLQDLQADEESVGRYCDGLREGTMNWRGDRDAD